LTFIYFHSSLSEEPVTLAFEFTLSLSHANDNPRLVGPILSLTTQTNQSHYSYFHFYWEQEETAFFDEGKAKCSRSRQCMRLMLVREYSIAGLQQDGGLPMPVSNFPIAAVCHADGAEIEPGSFREFPVRTCIGGAETRKLI
jgi:hypothetical protein